MCDTGYKAVFDVNKVEIVKNNKTHLEGHRDKETNLYMIDLDSSSKHQKPEKSIAQIKCIYHRTQEKPNRVLSQMHMLTHNRHMVQSHR